tara:strand:+ start:370 stop:528 length:159 start_codon:yes stop_codon:yes gene_type:complete
MKKIEVIKDLTKYFIRRKKYWLIPLCLVLVAFAAFLLATQGTVVAPFIYTIF